MSDERVEQVLGELDPTPAAEAEWPVSRRQTLRALASVGALAVAPGAASAQSAGTVLADSASFSNYGSASTANGYDLTIDGDVFAFEGGETIGLPDGADAEKVVLPDGATAAEVVGPDGGVVWQDSVIPDTEDFEHNDLAGTYGGDTGKFNIQTNFVSSGTYALESTGTSKSVPDIVHSTLEHGRDIKTTLKVGADPADWLQYYIYGAQSVAADPDAYRIDINYGGPGLELIDTATGTTIQSTRLSSTPAANSYHTVEIEWLSDGTHNISFINSSGTQLGSFSVTDSTYTEGHIGFSYEIGASVTHYWDLIETSDI